MAATPEGGRVGGSGSGGAAAREWAFRRAAGFGYAEAGDAGRRGSSEGSPPGLRGDHGGGRR